MHEVFAWVRADLSALHTGNRTICTAAEGKYSTGAPGHPTVVWRVLTRPGSDQGLTRHPPEWFTERGLSPGSTASTWPEAFTGEGSYLGLGVPGLDCADLGKQAGIAAAISWLESAGSGQRQRSYRLRDWLFSRQRYWGEPFPIVYDEHGLPIALPEESLPVTLPDMADFGPQPQAGESDNPVPPLARAAEWAEPELDLGDGPKRYRRELNTHAPVGRVLLVLPALS